MMFRQLTSDLVLLIHISSELTTEQPEQLAAQGIRLIDGVVERLEVTAHQLVGVRMTDDTVIAQRVLVIARDGWPAGY